MQRHFEKELENLRTDLIRMGSLVEEAISMSIKALTLRDLNMARKVIDGDERVNSLEIEIDNAIIDLLALQQPVAVDLRMILAAQKINNDLERLGDHAVNIAESVDALLRADNRDALLKIPQMAEVAQSMLRDALDCLIHQNAQMGKHVLEQDDIIDELNKTMVTEVVELMKNKKTAIEGGLELIRISRNLERVADLSTNIAEEVIFVTLARVVKHHAEEKRNPPT